MSPALYSDVQARFIVCMCVCVCVSVSGQTRFRKRGREGYIRHDCKWW